MDKTSVFVVLTIVDECGDILINCPNCYFAQKKILLLDNCACWKLLFTSLQCTKATSTVSNFGTSSPSLSWSTSLFLVPNNFIVSEGNSSNLYPVFTLKTILFLILLG